MSAGGDDRRSRRLCCRCAGERNQRWLGFRRQTFTVGPRRRLQKSSVRLARAHGNGALSKPKNQTDEEDDDDKRENRSASVYRRHSQTKISRKFQKKTRSEIFVWASQPSWAYTLSLSYFILIFIFILSILLFTKKKTILSTLLNCHGIALITCGTAHANFPTISEFNGCDRV